ncbi:MAG: hypothetical protein AAB456_04060 [Patescibacteria group bacterium]
MERDFSTLFEIQNANQNRGLWTADDPTVIGNAFQSVQNIVFDKFGFGPRKGYSLVGVGDNTGTTGINSLFSYKLSNVSSSTINAEVLLRSHTTWLEWFNELGGTSGEWHTLVGSLTSDKVFGFAPFNLTLLATIDNRLYFCNGVQNFSKWNGATTALNGALAGSETTVTVDDTTLFSSTGTFLINGTSVTYTGKTATTFTGCSGTPAAADNDGVAELPDTTTLSALPKINHLLTAFSRIWGFGGSGTVHGNRLFYSQAGSASAVPDPEDFTAASLLVDPGLRDFPEGGPNLNAIIQADDKIVVLKEDVINTYTFDYTNSTKQDIVGTLIQGPDVGCGARGAITQAKDRFFYVSKRGGLKMLGREEGSALFRPMQLTERILPTIKDFDFASAAIHYDQKNNFILVACASASGIDNDTIIAYDIRKDVITLFKNIAASSFVTYKGNTYFGHSITSKVYKLFDGLTDNNANINASATTQTYTFDNIGTETSLDGFYVEGLIKNSRELKVRFDFNDDTLPSKAVTLTGDTANNYVFALEPNTFGENEFGAYPFGGDPEELTGFNTFRVIIGFAQPINAFNVKVTFWSSGVGEQWRVRNYGWSPMRDNSESEVIKLII